MTALKRVRQTIHIRLDAEPFPVEPRKLRTLVREVLRRHGVSSARVDVVLTDDAQMRKMHQTFLQDPRTTDVISFDLSGPETPQPCFQILVNAAMALREARRRGHSPQAELSLYLIHGLLHNLGFDDSRPESAEQMHKREEELLRLFGYPPVYYSSPQKKTGRRNRRE
ncbi:MAG: rRNA maturation RNase YbeY [Anaerohalosphaeraceae bacterium]